MHLQEFSGNSRDPKVQIPFNVDSGSVPRKVEVERRKREYAELESNFESLLKDLNVDTQVFVITSLVRPPLMRLPLS